MLSAFLWFQAGEKDLADDFEVQCQQCTAARPSHAHGHEGSAHNLHMLTQPQSIPQQSQPGSVQHDGNTNAARAEASSGRMADTSAAPAVGPGSANPDADVPWPLSEHALRHHTRHSASAPNADATAPVPSTEPTGRHLAAAPAAHASAPQQPAGHASRHHRHSDYTHVRHNHTHVGVRQQQQQRHSRHQQHAREVHHHQPSSIMRQTQVALGIWQQLQATAVTPSTVLPPVATHPALAASVSSGESGN